MSVYGENSCIPAAGSNGYHEESRVPITARVYSLIRHYYSIPSILKQSQNLISVLRRGVPHWTLWVPYGQCPSKLSKLSQLNIHACMCMSHKTLAYTSMIRVSPFENGKNRIIICFTDMEVNSIRQSV